jgi:predicted  nucleic acid-binding Zn-ribbon protein
MNKTIQDLKMEIETIKKSQREKTLELENLGKRSGVIDASITNRIQEIEESLRGWRDGSEVKSTDCSSEGPEFNSQQPHGGSQPCVMRSDALF